ncbi:hypothetical protein [Micromonospora sicca]|uniref:hypothetical protein n=1 Tax=Micromonospora sicca TaxID=2202420 RepID=UPI00191C165B|nr:hypothetical protein [Micromonospora sp. 4G51]
MSTRCYVGATNAHQPHLVHARFVLFDGYPTAVIRGLANIWAGHAHQDTHVLLAAVLAHDWEYLDSTTTSGVAGAVPGVGVPLAAAPDGTVEAPDPITVFPLSQAVHLDVAWIYLIDADTDTVAVHTGDGEPTGRYHLGACVTVGPSPRRQGGVARSLAPHHCCVPAPRVVP